jgi:Nuclear fragile X mental retardation-interacting protein 1 (NUFIP1)
MHPIQNKYIYPQQYNQPQLQTFYPQHNAQGYTLSSTAYSLPAGHYKPTPSEQPDLSEEELRYSLEKASKKPTLGWALMWICWHSLPIEGTNIQLITIEDTMAWRAERKKKWLSKIASAVYSLLGLLTC